MARISTTAKAARPPVYRVSTAWGIALIRSDGEHVIGVTPPMAQDVEIEGVLDARRRSAPPAVRALAEAMLGYFRGEPVALATPEQAGLWLDAAGVTGFRRDVLVALAGVPRGVTVSYGDLAMLAGRPAAARAAGTACANNPLPVVVPCHRVVHAAARQGAVGPYGAASGSEYKRRLLVLEEAPLVLD